ncbi:MAG: hypothetical protein ACYCVN_06210 [Acidimicrobiales bacterium]
MTRDSIGRPGWSHRRRSDRPLAVRALACAIGLALVVPLAGASAGPAGAATSPVLTTTTTTDLGATQPIDFTVAGVPAGTALVAVECTIQALSLGQDACNSRRDTLVFAGASGSASGSFVPSPEMSTSLGNIDCTQPSANCLFGVASIAGNGSTSVIGAKAISFAPGVTATSPSGRSTYPRPPLHLRSSVPLSGPKITEAHPFAATVSAGLAPQLSSASDITGPNLPAPDQSAPSTPVAGQGIIELTMAAPRTSWESASHRAVVVDVSVNRGPAQQIVCFAGASPFTYAGFTGTLTTGNHPVSVTVDRTLSSTGSLPPTVRLVHLQVEVVAPSNPYYDRVAYAPVVYGRTDTARNDTPLLTYASEGLAPGGTQSLIYTTIWSREAAGTSFVPFLEWGEWGRMTDITETVALDVGAGGSIIAPTYESCGCTGTPATQNEVSPLEEQVPFSGSYFDQTHAVVRNASGNDYQVQSGTTAFRIQQVPVPYLVAGATRASVMDSSPWTYLISAQESSRWYTNGTHSPLSPEIGDARQYAIVDLTTSVQDVSATAVAIRLSGSNRWYTSDFGSGYPLRDGGHGRTVVKLPLGWESRPVTGVRLIYYPSGPNPVVKDVNIQVLGLTSAYTIMHIPLPAIEVVPSAPASSGATSGAVARHAPTRSRDRGQVPPRQPSH